MGYMVTLLYFWLSSPEVAIERVAKRVSNGGHHIPDDIVERRYYRGIKNLFNLYIPICDNWTIINNMDLKVEVVVEKVHGLPRIILNDDIWKEINKQSHGDQ
jgi:predicted ABC-type ATPase